MILVVVIANFVLITLYSILTSLIFDPWWVGYTIGSWIAVIELTIVIFVKYYQTFYQVRLEIRLIDCF